MTYRQLAIRLLALGCERDLKVGTVRAAVRQLDLEWDAFEQRRYRLGSRECRS